MATLTEDPATVVECDVCLPHEAHPWVGIRRWWCPGYQAQDDA